jgi:hypothetical protein
VRTAPPNDVATGGFDLGSRAGLDQAKDYLKELSEWTETLMVHLAPPCSTFSRARDRSWKTRLRSKDRPQGPPSCGPWCSTANKVARHSLELAEFAHGELKAVVTLENPHSSYLWGYLAPTEMLPYRDVVYSPCALGGSLRKPTRVRCWGWYPARLQAACNVLGDSFTCGRLRSDPHPALGFGGLSTAAAASYEPSVCKLWADEIRKFFDGTPSDASAGAQVLLVGSGKVRRHLLRGNDAPSKKELRKSDDESSRAGMRNPALLEATWPSLWKQMAKVPSCSELPVR